ncbi:MAG: efflux RND transporter periplasmic adaptor subunit, partial [Vicinamibacterales bacterium]
MSERDGAPRAGIGGRAVVVAVLLLGAAAATAAWGLAARRNALETVTRETDALAVVMVSVTTPERGQADQTITLPGTIQPFTDAAIFARTNGYLRKRHADLGSRVKRGQLLAEIDTPEVDQQLQQSRADLVTAEANARLAKTTAERYQDQITSESVSRQDLDNAVGGFEARNAEVESARANVSRLQQMQGFSRIYAPFDGVITARNTDIGALIDSGNGAKELFHVAATDRVRVFVSVPQVYSQAARTGLEATLTLREFPGRTFSGRIARTAEAIDVASRTLLTEVDVDNAKGELLPGAYAEVQIQLPPGVSSFRLPVNTLIFRAEGMQVATVQGGHVVMQKVTLGR